MIMATDMKLVGYILLFSVICSWAISAPTSDMASSTGQRPNGDTLVSLGIKLKNPLLKLVGLALRESHDEILCKLHHGCEDWSRWSACSVSVLGTFGVRNRTRQCGGTRGNCQTNDPEMTDVETSLCKRQCPQTYNYTKEGYCLRYVHKKVTQAEAESTCKSDGGFLVNINSENKLDSVAKMLDGLKQYTTSWVDGKRENENRPWVFSYEENIQGFTNWASGQPNNFYKDFCLAYILESSGWKMYDLTCTDTEIFSVNIRTRTSTELSCIMT